MKILPNIFGLILFVFVYKSFAEESLKDPRNRDEDISSAEITTTVTRLDGGIYEYIYSISSPVENTGTILSISIDISCDINFNHTEFPEPPDPSFRGSLSNDGLHTPIQAYRVPKLSGPPSISVDNHVTWLILVKPESIIPSLRVLSPAPPGLRQYRLTPDMDAQGWDYETYRDESPWIGDFMAYGMVTGPACALEPPEEPARFPGTSSARTSDELNGLLSYSEPLQDRFHLPAGTQEQAITIHYRNDLDPATFRVEPSQLRGKFHPQPGTSETVILPLGKPRNIIALEARPQRMPPGKGSEQAPPGLNKEPPQGNEGWRKDRDVFEIRVDGLPTEHKGNKS